MTTVGLEGMCLVHYSPSNSFMSRSAYLLAAAALSTVYGKLSDILGVFAHLPNRSLN